MCYDWSTELKLPALLGNFETIQLTDDGQYTSIVRHTSTKDARVITKNLKSNKTISPMSFTPSQTEAAIRKSRASKARGPDNISNLHLKHLGPAAIAYLT